jgi:hypothetical protein
MKPAYTSYLADLGFDWQRLAGAEVLDIEGQSAYDYIDYIAHTQTGKADYVKPYVLSDRYQATTLTTASASARS